MEVGLSLCHWVPVAELVLMPGHKHFYPLSYLTSPIVCLLRKPILISTATVTVSLPIHSCHTIVVIGCLDNGRSDWDEIKRSFNFLSG